MTTTPSPLSSPLPSAIRCHDFIETFSLGLEDMVTLEMPQARLCYEKLCQKIGAPLPAGMTSHDEMLSVAGRESPLRLRHLCPAGCQNASLAPVVYLHGGAWQIGSVETHQGVAASLANHLGRVVVSVDYRLLPDVSYRDLLEDCLVAVRHLSQTQPPAALVGDSAGARLVMDVTRVLSAESSPAPSPDHAETVLGLVYPPLDPVLSLDADDERTLGPTAPLLSREEIVSMWQVVVEGDASGSYAPSPAHSRFAPAKRIEVLSVEHDPLTAPLEAAIATWQAQGADIGYRCAPGMVHAALHAHHVLPEMGVAWRDFCGALKGRIDDA